MTNQTNNSTSDFISEVNSHVEESLNDYCSLSKPLQFAILLKGSWGCGKSWFINQYIEKLKKQDDTKTPLYVSLYGVNNFSQIEEALFEQTHPQLSSKTAKIARKAIKGLVSKYVINFDVNLDQKPDGNIQPSFSELSLKDFLNTSIKDDSKYNLLVFDDLERCSIDIEDIFGYINNFVDSQYLTVVIIADEDKIDEKYESDGKYKKIKEKLIRKTLEVFPDFQSALKSFIEKLKTEKTKDSLLNNINLIKDLLDGVEWKNIRMINQVILDFERVFKALPEKAQDKPELIEEILKLFTVFSIEIINGKIDPKKISQIQKRLELEEFQSQMPAKIRNGNSTEETTSFTFTQLFEKYKISYYDFNGLFPSLLWWESFFDKGIVNKDTLEKEILNNKYFVDETTPNWLKLSYYMIYSKYSDEEFSARLNEVDLEYKNRTFKEVGIIKYITGLFLMFSDFGLYSKSKSDIVNEAKKYIDELQSSGNLDLKQRHHIIGGYNVGKFPAEDYQEFQDVDDYIKQCQEKEIEKNMHKEAEKLLNIMQENVLKFHYCITHSIHFDISEKRYPEKIYSDYPVFKYWLPEDFVEEVLMQSNEIIPRIFYSLQERYNVNSIVEKLVDELDFLKEVQQLLLEEVDARKGKLSGFLLKRSNEILEKVISDLEQVKNSLPTTN